MPTAKPSSAAVRFSPSTFPVHRTIRTSWATNLSLNDRKNTSGKPEKRGMRRMMVTIFALLFLCEMTANAPAQERLNFVYISPNAGSSSVFWVAKDMGFFKKHGLDVNVIYIEGTPKGLMAPFAGELQVVAGTGPAGATAKLPRPDPPLILRLPVSLP